MMLFFTHVLTQLLIFDLYFLIEHI